MDTLNYAYEDGRKLVNKLLQHVGYDDASEWKVIVSIVGSCISNARCSAADPGDRRPARQEVARTSRVVGEHD